MSESQGVGLGVDDRLVQPDLTDVDRFVGVPMGGTQFTFPIEERDVRRFVEAMSNPNPLHFDAAYAAASRFGSVVMPQSMNFSQSTLPEGNIPGSHSLNSGSELWFYGPRLYPGDSVQFDRMLYGYALKNTRFAGPTVFVRSDTTCVGGRGDFIFKRRYTRARYLVENARKLGGIKSPAEEPKWSDAALADVDERKLRYIESLRGHETRPAARVAIGDALPEKVHGPHSVMTITLEAAARLDMLGSTSDNLALPLSHDFGGLATSTPAPTASARIRRRRTSTSRAPDACTWTAASRSEWARARARTRSGIRSSRGASTTSPTGPASGGSCGT